MNKADKFIKDTISEILQYGNWDKNPRPKWEDGSPAHSKFITQAFCKYHIDRDEFPITSLRPTALKGAFYDIEAIYIKQTNIIEEMHPSIHSWWKDFSISSDEYLRTKDGSLMKCGDNKTLKQDFVKAGLEYSTEYKSSLGLTYGAIVKKYALVDKLLKGLEENPFGRRHIIDMWQYHDQNRSPQSLVPCAFETLWSVREEEHKIGENYSTYKLGGHDLLDVDYKYKTFREIDLTLIQRSQDFIITASINPIQYVMLGTMVCNHLTYKTGIKHSLGNFSHFIQNCHIYDKHIETAKELLNREPLNIQPTIELTCEPKDFYNHTIEDFTFNIPPGIKKLNKKLELAI